MVEVMLAEPPVVGGPADSRSDQMTTCCIAQPTETERDEIWKISHYNIGYKCAGTWSMLIDPVVSASDHSISGLC